MRAVIRLVTAATLAMAMPFAGALATEDDNRSISGMLNHNNVLLVFAPKLADARLAEQRRWFAHFGAVAATSDLLLVQVADGKVIGAHDKSEKLRERFKVGEDAYRSLLIAKDGRIVIDQPNPIDEPHLAQAIGVPLPR